MDGPSIPTYLRLFIAECGDAPPLAGCSTWLSLTWSLDLVWVTEDIPQERGTTGRPPGREPLGQRGRGLGQHTRSAAKILRSSAVTVCSTPPAARNASTTSRVRCPFGQGELRSRIEPALRYLRSRPAMVHAALIRLITAMACELAMARNAQCASFSVHSSITSTRRPWKAGFVPGWWVVLVRGIPWAPVRLSRRSGQPRAVPVSQRLR